VTSALLSLLLLLSLCVSPASATEQATVSISSGQVKAGESVTLTLSIADNPGLATCLLYVYYDTSVFTVDPDEDIVSTGRFKSSGAVVANSIAGAKLSGRYYGDIGKNGAVVLWYSGSGQNVSANGDMITITLKAAATAPAGSYTVSIGYSATDTRNADGKQVSLQTTSATVTVSRSDSGSTDTGTGTGTVPQQPLLPEIPATLPTFYDISGHWAEAYIWNAAAKGLVVGHAGYYRPDDTMTRAECVTILWRASGEPAAKKASSFTDLEKNQTWYHDAVAWAEENGVINGVAPGKFDPNGTVTREQLMTILHRRAGTPVGMELMMASFYNEQFKDSGKISSWAKNAVYWSVYNDICCGEDHLNVGETLAPAEPANRAQIAVMMVRYLEM